MPKKDELFLNPRVGLVPDLSKQNYDTLSKQIREAVTNSLDARASKVDIFLNLKGTPNIIIVDNGEGMKEEEFKEEYLGLGGSKKYGKEEFAGNIGIGFLALGPTCKTIEIYSKTKSSGEIIHATLNIEDFYNEKNRRYEVSKFPIGIMRNRFPCAPEEKEQSFTKIVLKDLNQNIVADLKDSKKKESIIEQLQRILPVKYNPKSLVFKHLPELKRLYFSNQSINKFTTCVTFDGKEIIRKMYGDENTQIGNLSNMRVINSKIDNIKYIGYIHDNMQVIKPRNWQKLLIRIKNVAVGEPTFLDFQEKGISSRGPRIEGELHAIGLSDEALLIGRNIFNESHKDYLNLKSFVHEILEEETHSASVRVKEKQPFKKRLDAVKNLNSSFKKFSKNVTIQSYINQNVDPPKNKLGIHKTVKPVDVGDLGKNITFKNKKDDKNPYTILWTGKKGTKPKVVINSDKALKQKLSVSIGKNLFQCEFKKGRKNEDICEIDYVNKKVYFNKNHKFLDITDSKLISSFLGVRLAYDSAKDKEQFYENMKSTIYQMNRTG